LAALAGISGAFAGSLMAEPDAWPGTLEPDPILRAENQQQLVVGMERAAAEGDVELAAWIAGRLGER
jgi:hypothetical protein